MARHFFKTIATALCGTLLNITSIYAISTFAPYNDFTINLSEGGQPQDLTIVSGQSGVTQFRLGFINDVSKGACNPGWGGATNKLVSAGWGAAILQKMTSLSLKYVISLGGETGTDLSGSCPTVQSLTQAYQNIINTYPGLQGLDFDIENGSENRTNLIAALQNIQALYPNLALSFTLKVLPTGLFQTDQTFIAQANAAGLRFLVNVMTMNFGTANCNPAQFEKCTEQAATSVYTFLSGVLGQTGAPVWAKVGVTQMIGLNDQIVFQLSQDDARTFNAFAKSVGMGLVSMWSLGRDHSCAVSAYAQPTCSGADAGGRPFQSHDWQYSQNFMQ